MSSEQIQESTPSSVQIEVVQPHAEIETPTEWTRIYSTLLERWGRTCYKSEEKIGEETADPFVHRLTHVLKHESVIEHLSFTVRIICSRSCSHQLVRHRIGSYSQESQRFCDYAKDGKNILQVICPPKVADIPPGIYTRQYSTLWKSGDEIMPGERGCLWLDQMKRAYECYLYLRDSGVPAEDARSVLPNATKTEIVTTYNLRQWLHVFRDRALNPKAQWEIRGIMVDLLNQFAHLVPCVFADFLTTPPK